MQSFELIKSHVAERWQRLSGREKRITALLIAVCAVLFIYFAVISPLFAWKTKNKTEMQLNHESLVFVQNNISRAQQAQAASATGNKNPGQLITLISSSAKRAGITFSRIQPAKQDIALWINDVSYQQLINWILPLYNQFQINVKQTRIEKTEDEGVVKVFLRLGY